MVTLTKKQVYRRFFLPPILFWVLNSLNIWFEEFINCFKIILSKFNTANREVSLLGNFS